MANLISTADGNLTAAATWATVDTTALVTTGTAANVLDATNKDATNFQPGAITVDGVAIKLAVRAAGSPTNTMTVILRNVDAGADVATVTVNVSDLAPCTNTGNSDREGGWYFFKFAATHLLLAATNYTIRLTLSATTTAVSIATNGTLNNWQHMLRTTTTQAPGAGDNLHIMGEFDGASNPATTSTRSVTMDSTAATDYGSATADSSEYTAGVSVNHRATLAYGTAGATNYILRISGHLIVFSGGTLTIGATGAEIPRGSTAVLEFDCASDGQFGLILKRGCTCSGVGLSRTVGKDVNRCKLTADSAATDTTLDVDTDTGWLSGDDIAIAPTTQTYTQFERRTLSVNAGAALLTVTAGLTNTHLGSNDYFAEVILLTRNVEIRSVSTSFVSYFRAQTTATVTFRWVSFRYVSSSTVILTIETTSGGSLTLQHCVFQDLDNGISISGTGHGGWTIDQCAIYNQRIANGAPLTISLTTGTWTLTDLIIMGATTLLFGIRFLDVGGTIGNLTVTGCQNGGINWEEAAVESGNGPTWSGTPTWVLHSNGGSALFFTADVRDITFPRTEIWRHVTRGVALSIGAALDNVEFNGGFWLGNGPGTGEEPTGMWFGGDNPVNDVRFRSLAIAADSGFASNWGILFDKGRIVANNIQFIDCVFSETTGTRRQTGVADIGCIADVAPGSICVQGIATNCRFNSAGTPISFYYAAGVTPTRNSKYSAIRCPKYNGVATTHRTYTARGTFIIETGTVDVTPALQILPLEGAAVPVDSNGFQPGWGFLVPVLSGQSVTVSVKVQKSAGYNGSTEPQLVLLANAQIGVASDVVIDTLSVGAGSWETLTGTTAAAAADGVMEFVVRSYGTAGSVYVDTWSAA